MQNTIILLKDLLESSKIEVIIPSLDLVKKIFEAYANFKEVAQIYDFMIAYGGVGFVDYIISDDNHFIKIFNNKNELNQENCPIVLKSKDISN